MAPSTPSGPARRLPPAIAISIGLALAGAVAWYTWTLAARSREAAAASAASATAAAPRSPAFPEGQLTMLSPPTGAPIVALPTVDGGRFSLADARGQVVLLNLWASWCEPCQREMPSLQALARELSARHPGKLRVVAVSIDEDPSAARAFFSKPPFDGLPAELVVALDPGPGKTASALACAGRGACRTDDLRIPETYVVDTGGRIVAVVVGNLDWSLHGARTYLEALLGS